uniref:DC1 domain-containing protein n=1 Tax=Lactuca sativa TaxID=4236 RepID=A0A9R1X5W6_LACSA|nr:hypothetical protein LSAT_V11C600329120 [Lactuca sativa]
MTSLIYRILISTFSYKCKTCTFNLDVNCAFLPNTIKHKSHKHPLIQVIDTETPCNACDMGFSGISYACKACDFLLDMFCAIRSPHSLGHRWKCTPSSPFIIATNAKIPFTSISLLETIILMVFWSSNVGQESVVSIYALVVIMVGNIEGRFHCFNKL